MDPRPLLLALALLWGAALLLLVRPGLLPAPRGLVRGLAVPLIVVPLLFTLGLMW